MRANKENVLIDNNKSVNTFSYMNGDMKHCAMLRVPSGRGRGVPGTRFSPRGSDGVWASFRACALSGLSYGFPDFRIVSSSFSSYTTSVFSSLTEAGTGIVRTKPAESEETPLKLARSRTVTDSPRI